MITFKLNGDEVSFKGDPDMPLLWYLRDERNLTGTKFGCGVAMCGACTVHLNGSPVRSCATPVAAVKGAEVTTIEGLDSTAAVAVQKAWRTLDVVQCGYCQSGQIMAATGLLANNDKPTDSDIDQAMQGNLCRCATYQRIRSAIHQAAADLAREA